MRERPILFSAPMVRALLAGAKTQTRRIVKPEGADHLFQFRGTTAAAGADEPTGEWGWCGSSHVVNKHIRCPYGKPGDRLLVREAWRAPASCDHLPPRSISDSEPIRFIADEVTGPDPGFGRYRPPMFMPRWASRITLEVTEVHVERLQEISEADAVAEGITFCQRLQGWHVENGTHFHCVNPRESYWSLWESINGPDSWAANPFVWAITFRRLQ